MGKTAKKFSLGQEEQRAWQLWKEKVKQFKKRRQQGTAPIFISEMEVLGHVFNGVKQDESCIQVEYLQSREELARLQAIKSEQHKAEAAASQWLGWCFDFGDVHLALLGMSMVMVQFLPNHSSPLVAPRHVSVLLLARGCSVFGSLVLRTTYGRELCWALEDIFPCLIHTY